MENKGWGPCQGTKKWHYFVRGRSLCGSFMLFFYGDAKLEDDKHDSVDNCATCRKKLEKKAIIEAAKKANVEGFTAVSKRSMKKLAEAKRKEQ